jgi:ABC-type multidrug transport system ATPase subunit
LISLNGKTRNGGANIVIFADEPTTGLDSYQALKVVEILRDLANKDGYTVIASIHQPRASIFELFDEITLMR